MNFTALIFAIMLILGLSSYESKAEAASVNNEKLLIGWYEDRSTPISADNSYRTEILNLIEALDEAEQLERFNGAKLPVGHIIKAGGDVIEFGAYDEDSIQSAPEVEGWVSVPGRTALYIKDDKGLRLYDWEYYLKLDMLARNAQYEELAGGTFVGEVKSNDPHSGTGYCLISEEYGEVCVTLIEPVFADEGELMEVTILPQEEPLTRITPIYAEAEKLYK